MPHREGRRFESCIAHHRLMWLPLRRPQSRPPLDSKRTAINFAPHLVFSYDNARKVLRRQGAAGQDVSIDLT